MLIFAGLGNPGAKYAGNRHNIGFMAVDRIAADHGFGPWKAQFQGRVSEGRLGGQKILLLKPETFMNLSGQAVGEAMRYYKLTPGDVTVLHDEIDLAPGKVRVKTAGGHAGHNGLRSIHSHIGADYRRVRLGVGHPGRKEAVPHYVLQDFAKADADWLEAVLCGVSDGAPYLADGSAERFQNAVAQRVAPARTSGAGGKVPAAAAPRPATDGADKSDAPEVDTRTALQRLADRFR